MAQTLIQIQSQISKLQAQADVLKAKEAAQVVARIQEAIAHYGLTTDMLFGAKVAATQRVVRQGKAKTSAKASAKKAPASGKYHDGAGRTWSGHGKRPNWFKDAITGGKKAEDLLIKAATA